MSFLQRLFSRSKNINMTICGLDKAGKTTILNFLVHGEFRETIPTMGINRETINFPKLAINVFDLGGQEDFRGLWNEINEKSDALVFIIDGTDIVRLLEAKEVFNNVVRRQITEDTPVLILLNKVDLPDCISRAAFIKEFGLLDVKLPFTWACFPTSAKTGEGIYESFSWFFNMLKGV